MRPLSINFAWHRERKAEHIGFPLLACAITVALGIGWWDAELQRELDTRLTEQQGLQRTPEASRSVELSPEDRERQRAELKMAQGVIEHLDTPWGVLFAAVESAFDDQVTLLNVEPEPERREVRLTAEAKDLQAMQAYIRQLRQSPALKEAYLASHQINQQDPLRPVRFVANARWVVPEENTPNPNDKSEKVTSEAVKLPAEDIPENPIRTVTPDAGNERAAASVAPVAKKGGE